MDCTRGCFECNRSSWLSGKNMQNNNQYYQLINNPKYKHLLHQIDVYVLPLLNPGGLFKCMRFFLFRKFFHIKNLMNLFYITYKLIKYKPKTLYWFWKRVYRKSYLGPKSYNQINITYIFARIESGPRYNLETRNQMGKKKFRF